MGNANAIDGTHWIWARFDRLNARHFRGKLSRPQTILRSSLAHREAQVVETTVGGKRVSMLWIDGDSLDNDKAKATDSLLHEMIHMELALKFGDADLEHGARFIARADEIGRALGLKACRQSEWSMEQAQRVASVWPQVQREEAAGRKQPTRAATTAGRNDPCPCGSGKKFKRCCLDQPVS